MEVFSHTKPSLTITRVVFFAIHLGTLFLPPPVSFLPPFAIEDASVLGFHFPVACDGTLVLHPSERFSRRGAFLNPFLIASLFCFTLFYRVFPFFSLPPTRIWSLCVSTQPSWRDSFYTVRVSFFSNLSRFNLRPAPFPRCVLMIRVYSPLEVYCCRRHGHPPQSPNVQVY